MYAEALDTMAGLLRQLTPPQELQAYHDANLDVVEAIRDHAMARPSEDSFVEEFTTFILEILEASLEIGFDTTRTPEERQRLIEEIAREKLGELFGPDFVAASLALEEARAELSEEVLTLLANCELLLGEGGEDDEVVDPNTPDDHSDDAGAATAVEVGANTQGSLDYQGDTDFFRFAATAGQFYQIDVALGTLDDSMVALHDSGGWELTSNDDYGGSLASRIVWQAPDTGDYYVAVAGWGTGSYTLTVDLSDVVDDHGNGVDSATAVVVGVDTQASLDYEGDTDFFSFTATAGQLYQIDVALGTLEDSEVSIVDADEWELGYNDDHGDSFASRIVWEAPDTSDYYVKVAASWAGTGTGSYTLTVNLSDVVDDHGNDTDNATVVKVGADTQGSLDYEGDTDLFRFTATAGQLYQIDVALGTLDDSEIAVLDSDEWQLEYNDDHGDSLASRIFWEAPESGDYFVRVAASWASSTGAGSYTLTVALR